MNKVLLLSMPFGALARPALGISLLKAELAEAGVACDVRYPAFSFAEFTGYEDYQWVSSALPYTAFAGDWTFTPALYGDHPDLERRYIQEVLRGTWRLDPDTIQRLLRVRALVPHFLDYCMMTISWHEYALVGFTSTFEQNIASLALAKRVKAVHPGLAIVFGGANWEAEMGCELHRQFPFVDYVCSGEADHSFPALVRRVLAGEPVAGSNGTIRGIVYRAGGASVYTGQAELIRDMDSLPIPDFSDYFQDLAQSTVAASVVPTLLLETSRGCWWGAKSHCTFCGLNGGTMTFRGKSARRAIAELEFLVDRWQIDMVEAVDNILEMKYFNDMLPTLAQTGRSIQLFYEVKANLSRTQVQILHAAGVNRIQPGLESLSDHVLQLMRKGTTALRNIQLLKWCKEYNISVDWNLLYFFPGETREDYAAMLHLLPSIRFLQPPTACGPLRLDRFSPYYNAPAAFGFINVRPMVSYKYLYPFDDESLHRIAYYFDYDYETGVDPTGYAALVVAYVEAWRREPERGALYSIMRPDGTLALVDTRSDAARPELVFSGLEQEAYEYCDTLHTGASVAQHLRRTFPDAHFTDQQVLAFLDSLVANKLMVTADCYYLSLAVRAQLVM
jgi:ribosomal peptide maturation radical SAM protein 1